MLKERSFGSRILNRPLFLPAAPLNPLRPFPVSSTSSKNDGVLIAVFFGLIYPLIVLAGTVGYLCLWRKGGRSPPSGRDVERGQMTEAEKDGKASVWGTLVTNGCLLKSGMHFPKAAS